MKNIKRILALVLALTMVLSMSAFVFADEPTPAEKYTITAPDGDHTYEVYQIFTGDLSDGKLSNIKWGTNGTGTTGGKVDQTTLDSLTAVNESSDNEKLAVITNYASLSNPVATLTGETLSYECDPGYYLIKDKDNSIEDPTGDNVDAYTTYVVKVVGDVEFSRKADVPEVVKNIVEGTEKVKKNNAAVGDTVTYEIVGTMPSNIADYDTYFMQFTDTLSKGLTLDTDTNGKPAVTVTVNGEDATKYFWIDSTVGSDNTSLIVSIQDLLDLSDDTTIGAITADTTVVVSYTATVNKDAVIDSTGNKNEVDLEFYNDPNHSGTPDDDDDPPTPPVTPPEPDDEIPTGTTPKADTYTYVTELTVKKVDEEDNALTGAKFKLEGEALNITKVEGIKYEKAPYTAQAGETVNEGTYYLLTDGTYTTTAPSTAEGANNSKYASLTDTYVCVSFTKWLNEGTEAVNVEAFVDESGELTFTGLKAGEYTLTETVTPAGYNTIDPKTITVVFDEEDNVFYIDELYDEEDETSVKTMEITVVNESGTELPETGGIGTTIFYILGGILLAGAAVLLITKKRMSSAA